MSEHESPLKFLRCDDCRHASACQKVGECVLLEPVAALFVERDGVYADLPEVQVWDEERDARLYDGPYPVVAHPPCARWSRLAGFTEARFGYKRGADGGCFVAALESVRTFGGVLEHPAYSKAWDTYGLPEPTWREGWTGGICGGYSAYVEQGRYGLPVKKATWLYAYGVELSELRWGYTPDGEGPDGGGMDDWRKRVSYAEGAATPVAFRDELIGIARSAYGLREASSVCRRCEGDGYIDAYGGVVVTRCPDCMEVEA